MFCPKCGKKLEERRAGVKFGFGRYHVVVYGCVTCQQASVTGPDELGLQKHARAVNQQIGTVGHGSTVVGMVIEGDKVRGDKVDGDKVVRLGFREC